MNNCNAHWIDLDGVVIPVPVTHINAIIKDPARFGLTIEHVQNTFEEHNEPMGLEGDAREHIMGDLISSGWIRVRYYNRDDRHMFQVKELNESTKDRIVKFLSSDIVKNFSTVEIKDLSGFAVKNFDGKNKAIEGLKNGKK